MSPMLTRLLKALLPILVLGVALAAAFVMWANRPPVETLTPVVTPPAVRVQTVAFESVDLTVSSQGTVQPRTSSQLVPEIAGTVIAVSPAFAVGGFFEEGDVLLEIDPYDYQQALIAARSQLAQAQLRLAQEEAEAEVARREWEEIGQGDATPLTLRLPQVEDARAAVASAEAAIDRATRDLERAQVRAPYAGRVQTKDVDVGQFVNRGTAVGRIYAVDSAEVRLPLPDEELAYVDVPMSYRGAQQQTGPAVTLSADFAGRRFSWQGRIVRTEGEIDPVSRMVHVVAEVDDPYAPGPDPDRPPLAVGMFVEAEITGRRVDDVVMLPWAALNGRDQVLIVDDDGRLRYRQVDLLRSTTEHVLVQGGLAEGERVSISALDAVIEGMAVQVAGADPAAMARAGGPGKTAGRGSGEPGAGRNETALLEAPECDQQLAGERHDHDPAHPPVRAGDASFEPEAERAVGLEAQPAPRHLDELGPDPAGPVAPDPLVALDSSARPRGWRHPGPARHLAAVVEVAVKDLVDEQGRIVRADPPQPGQDRDPRRRAGFAIRARVWRRQGFASADNRVALGLDIGDLPLHQRQPLGQPFDLAPDPRRQRLAIGRPRFGKMHGKPPGPRAKVENAVQLQQSPDRIAQRRPFLHQAPALAQQPLAVLLFHARHPHPAQHRRIAPVVRQKRAHHLLRVDPVRLALPRLAVHQKARRVEHHRLHRQRPVQPARQPEPLVARLVAAQNPHRTAQRPFRIGPTGLDQPFQRRNVRRRKRVKTDPRPRRTLDPQHPTLAADLDRNIQRAMFNAGRRRSLVPWGHLSSPYQGGNNGTVAPVAGPPHRI